MTVRIVTVTIEVPRGSFLKWEGARIEYFSPFPCPFNYGAILGSLAADGDPPDAIVLGPALPRGSVVTAPVWGAVAFCDAGVDDRKLVVATSSPTPADWRRLERFFRIYAPLRRLLNRLQGKRGVTRFEGVVRGS